MPASPPVALNLRLTEPGRVLVFVSIQTEQSASEDDDIIVRLSSRDSANIRLATTLECVHRFSDQLRQLSDFTGTVARMPEVAE